MTVPKSASEIEINDDLSHHKKVWVMERTAWGIMALTLAAALVGLLGPGPLSSAKARSIDGGLSVTYERFARYHAPTQLKVFVGNAAVRDGRVKLSLNRAFVEKCELERIDPEAERVELESDRLTYVFRVSLPSAAPIVFRFKPDSFGPVPVQVGMEGGETLQFTSFVYP
jgi:hypothetical protein